MIITIVLMVLGIGFLIYDRIQENKKKAEVKVSGIADDISLFWTQYKGVVGAIGGALLGFFFQNFSIDGFASLLDGIDNIIAAIGAVEGAILAFWAIAKPLFGKPEVV